MNAENTAAEFRRAVEAGDPDALEPLLAEHVVFRSPAVHTPYEGQVATMIVLRAVTRVFEDFRYTRSYAEQGHALGGHALVFEATVAGKSVEGIDLIRVDGDGLIDDLRVLVRPLSGINALVARMGEEIPKVMTDMGLG
ncbi:nuclear transport factor 2 family protein [Nocardioides sp. HDW12B]|uniref:nuclear transport factor 2 family protein n=1 Tax=Nocardioides sp. HDW12B TaxID=2714939 RepID=UPI0014081C0E|nr:nuclear transport factor 2 family protein [Nocardioides sp. HDW12B]QIK65684.1 nuclear transport factor 2 family protein [Nocardioides sp. HDW12B]